MKMLLTGALLLSFAYPAAAVDLTFSTIVVNGVTIPASRVHTDLNGRRQGTQMLHGSASIAGSDVKMVEQVVDRIIVRELLAQEARRRGHAVSEAEFATAWADERKRWGGDEEKFAKSLVIRGISAEYLQERVREDLLLHKLVEGDIYSKVVVTEQDERTHYDKNSAHYTVPGPPRLRCLYIDNDKHGGEQGAISRYKAFRARLDRGEQFATLIEEFSDHPTAAAGGIIGEDPDPAMPFFEAARTLRPGQFTYPRNNENGLYCYYRDDRAPALSFDESRARIRTDLIERQRKERLNQLVSKLRATAVIDYRP